MILATKNILAKLLEYEVARFLIVGGTTVLIDLICYFILIYISPESCGSAPPEHGLPRNLASDLVLDVQFTTISNVPLFPIYVY